DVYRRPAHRQSNDLTPAGVRVPRGGGPGRGIERRDLIACLASDAGEITAHVHGGAAHHDPEHVEVRVGRPGCHRQVRPDVSQVLPRQAPHGVEGAPDEPAAAAVGYHDVHLEPTNLGKPGAGHTAAGVD